MPVVEDVRHSPPDFNDRHTVSVHILLTSGIEQELFNATGQYGLL